MLIQRVLPEVIAIPVPIPLSTLPTFKLSHLFPRFVFYVPSVVKSKFRGQREEG
jgi:hypothetical protein